MQVRAMRKPTHSRRDVLKASAAMAAGAVFAEPLKAATAEPSAVTSALIEAARKEGKISFYTALELPTSERLAKAFEAKYPGIAVRVERSGAERIFQRIGQEQASRIYASMSFAARTQPTSLTGKARIGLHPQMLRPKAEEPPCSHGPSE